MKLLKILIYTTIKKKHHLHAYNELTTHYLQSHIIFSALTRHAKNGWFVVGTAGPDVGVVVDATAVGTLHEYIGFGMQSHAKMCA